MSNLADLSQHHAPLLPITAKWALPLTIYYLSLALRVGKQRFATKTWMGDRSHGCQNVLTDPLHTAIRAQANFLEYVPLALILAGAAELNGADKSTLDLALGALLAVRIAHVEVGLLWKKPPTGGYGRLVGFWGTSTFLVGVAGWGFWLGRA
ncbi:hypothetical protein FKW77_007091 [Venturia effusa]|uniref:MAPEG family protein n=1 Tax=Venturia effusa TaxID=50376 RepID=A0A517KWQ2_9PEZI|nr:hypothetical protein FKW77_007091 [Venturia effusa]